MTLLDLPVLPPNERFSSRVGNYVRYRPSYPPEIVRLLTEECGLGPNSTVADIGAGTGILTALLLGTGAQVYAIEPNPEMRAAAEVALSARSGFHSLAASAESTGLPSDSVQLITCAQAFHWVKEEEAVPEFHRILAPGGSIALIWNVRLTEGDPFLHDYDALLQRTAPEYTQAKHRDGPEGPLDHVFAAGAMRVASFPNRQEFDFDGLVGRVLSSSYVPTEGPDHEALIDGLRSLFDRYQIGDRVRFRYETKVFYGRANSASS